MTATIILAIACAAQSVAIAVLVRRERRRDDDLRVVDAYISQLGAAVSAWVERGTVQPDETCACSMCRERRARKAGMVS